MSREDFERHELPNGLVIFYRDRDHRYFTDIEPVRKRDPDGEWKGCGKLKGVSTVSAPFDWSPEGLMRWAARLTVEGIAGIVEEELDSGQDAETVLGGLEWLREASSVMRALEQRGLRYEDTREQRAEEGTNVHKHALYALASGKPVPDFHQLTDNERGYAQGVAAFWMEHAPKVIAAERVVADPALGIAGRLDLLYEDDGRLGLLDCKTSGFIPLKHHVQVAGYDHCARACGLIAPDAILDSYILQVDEDGGFKLVAVRADASDFVAACDVYSRAGRLRLEAKHDREAVTA